MLARQKACYNFDRNLKKRLTWRINEEIRAHEVRVIDSDGGKVEVLSISEALKKAKEKGTDLVEIAPNAQPPVVKIIDFGKFRYTEEKKLREQMKKAKPAELKEVRLSPFIGDADYKTRVRQVDKFLHNGHKVKVVVVFKGRQLGSKKFGYVILQKVIDEITHEITVDMNPKFLGRHLAMVISPMKKSVSQKEMGKDDAKTPARNS